MRREDYVFCIGYEGSTAIVDGKLMRRHRSHTTGQLAEAGLFKQAVCSALWSGRPEELEEVLSIFNQQDGDSARGRRKSSRGSSGPRACPRG